MLNKNKIICVNGTADALKLREELLDHAEYNPNGKVLHQWQTHFMSLDYIGTKPQVFTHTHDVSSFLLSLYE